MLLELAWTQDFQMSANARMAVCIHGLGRVCDRNTRTGRLNYSDVLYMGADSKHCSGQLVGNSAIRLLVEARDWTYNILLLIHQLTANMFLSTIQCGGDGL